MSIYELLRTANKPWSNITVNTINGEGQALSTFTAKEVRLDEMKPSTGDTININATNLLYNGLQVATVATANNEITNGTQKVKIELNGAILYDGGSIQKITKPAGLSYVLLAEDKIIVIEDSAMTTLTLPISQIGTEFIIRREYPLQPLEQVDNPLLVIFPASATIDGYLSVGLTAYTTVKLLFIGNNKWIII